MSDLSSITDRLNAATWKPAEAFSNGIQSDWGIEDENGNPIIDGWLDRDLAELLAHAPADLTYLLGRVKEAEGQREAVLKLHTPMLDEYGDPSSFCEECTNHYPCDSVVALGGETE